MKTSDSLVIRSSYRRIFELAANVEEWGRILPHYRYVNVLKQDGNRKLVRMSAWREFIPVTWSAIETIYPGTEALPGSIRFHHVRGVVRGMDVEWSFQVREAQGDVLVTISHDLSAPPFPVDPAQDQDAGRGRNVARIVYCLTLMSEANYCQP